MTKKRHKRRKFGTGPYATAAYDGYRIRVFEDSQSVLLDAQLVQGGRVVDGQVLEQGLGKSFEQIAAIMPGVERQAKVARAMLRFLNEGGDILELHSLLTKISDWHDIVKASPIYPLAGADSEETHARTFALPNGNYLYIVEGIEAEELTASQLRALYEGAIEV